MKYSDKVQLKERIILILVLGFNIILISMFLNGAIFNKKIYTIEVYQIFEVVHLTDKQGKDWTNIYTYGQGQFYFRGNHEIDLNKSYSFTYTENGKRWRDLNLLEFHEFVSLRRID